MTVIADIYVARQQSLQGGILANTGSNAGPRTVAPVSIQQRPTLSPPRIMAPTLVQP
jgi:hypothetical protein